MAMELLSNVICGMVELPCRHFKQATNVSVTTILITNGIVHVDNALYYAYLIPFRNALWVHEEGAFRSLIIVYSLLSLSCVAKLVVLALIGRFCLFGIPGVTLIRYALSGAGVGTIVIGLLPFWAETPVGHGIGLGFSCILVDICASTVYHFLRVYIMEHHVTFHAPSSSSSPIGVFAASKKHAVLFELYGIMGLFLACGIGTLWAISGQPSPGWPISFIASGLCTLLYATFASNLSANKQKEVCAEATLVVRKGVKGSWFGNLWDERTPIIRIIMVSGFSYMLYAIPLHAMNILLPLVATLPYAALWMHTMIILVVMLLCLLGCYHIAPKVEHNNLMACASGLVALTIIPLFSGLPNASVTYVCMVRIWLAVLGAVLSAFVAFWSKEQIIHAANRYSTLGFATVVGNSLFGSASMAICLYLYQLRNNMLLAAAYIAICAFISMLILADSASPEVPTE